MTRIAGLFPGQGSQAVGMGKDFLNSSEQARELFEQADKALGYSLSSLCLEGPLEELTLTKNAQPAILLVSFVSFALAGIEVQSAAGHSLGEYTALVAAGCLKFEDAVQLVHKRGCYMQEAVPAGLGRMVAVMGPSEEEIRGIIGKVSQGVVEIANLNSPGQTVVAGDVPGVTAFADKIAAAGAKVISLNVSAPFHCSLMKPAADQLSRDLDAIAFSDPKFPVYSNVTATKTATAAEARERLKQQVCGSVRWTGSIANMVKEQQITHTVEFGAGSVLTKLMKRIDSSLTRLEVHSPESVSKSRQALAL